MFQSNLSSDHKAEKLKNNREKAILEVSETEMDNLNN